MSLLHSALVQVLSNSPAESRSSNRFGWTIKNPRAFAAVSGSLHKLAPYLAWVCCPLIGFSPYSTCEVVTVCALQNISTSARADRSEQHRRLYTAAWRACQPGRNIHKNTKTASRGALLAAGQIFGFEVSRPAQAVVGALSGGCVAASDSRCGRRRPSSCGLGMKPTIRSTASPPLNRIMVGIPVTPNCIGVS